ncbi:hypothetical protein DFQ03_0433 [Maribacter caenipelagi]|uniref:SpoIIAA-like protein n=1 Tax=Maribacter caenipelagi TaxID=1447781 RepID=A0A4R7DBG7_9FLAO|nr:hypothetical protein [Maribacter caenipelagi]TDS18723.1 hypothetical protein DFQ03_0433 [Maribacter caenipelagi]
MKRVRELELVNQIREIREFEFGVFYFFKGGIVISEMHEGAKFKWQNAKKAVYAAQEIYGNDIPLIYIANRVNRYRVAPFEWFKFHKNRFDMQHIASVGPLRNNMFSSMLKQLIFPKRIKTFPDLDKAVDWALRISKNSGLSSNS